MKRSLQILGLSGLMAAPAAFGAGFQLNEFSVAAMGRSNAGEPAMTDTAAAMARNPAVLTRFDSRSMSVVLHYIDPEVDVKGTTSSDYGAPVDASADDIAPDATVPGFYYISPVDDTWAWGLSINSYFGLASEYDDYASSEYAGETEVKTVYLSPNFAFNVTDDLSLGVAIQFIHAEGVIHNTVSSNLNGITTTLNGGFGYPIFPEDANLLKLEGDGNGVGYQVGLHWQINETSSLGFRYQSDVDLDLEGDIDYLPLGISNGEGELTVGLPAVYELGFMSEVSDGFTVLLGLQKTAWSSFETLTADVDGVGDILLKEEYWNDAWRYSVGLEYAIEDTAVVRFGLGYDESPVDAEYRTLTIPDADRDWVSVGATFNLEAAGSIDVAVLFINGESVEVNESLYSGNALLGDLNEFNGELSSTSATVFSLGYNYSF